MAVSTFLERMAAIGVDVEVRQMDDTTHTAVEAATALGTTVAAIVKSLLFMVRGEPLLVLASGPNRVDTGLLAAIVGGEVSMADAKSVKVVTGYSIGGVPPIGHPEALRTIIDEDLLVLPLVWAAAGSASAVFGIEPHRLAELSGATVARLC
jgi:prolyl-tRNA editing enzyme YbaK/EbsC (Cys-tRNA(Pro) deacylase)